MILPRPKYPILLSDLSSFDIIDKAIIESIDQSLFRLELEVKGKTFYVIDAPGRPLTRRSILEFQALLTAFNIKEFFLSHNSPYDEMIGQSVNEHGNTLLVRLGNYFSKTGESPVH